MLAIVVGGAVGAAAGATAFWFLTGPIVAGGRTFGPWFTSRGIGQSRQNPYTRAQVALYGTWGLPPSEVVYFSALKDSSGAKLRRDCTYEVRGGPLPARWWSLTLYRNGFYIDNPANRYSWSLTDVVFDPQGRWTITLAPSGEGRNHLTFGPDAGLFLLSLRLYQPQTGIADHRDRVPLPEIHRIGCGAV